MELVRIANSTIIKCAVVLGVGAVAIGLLVIVVIGLVTLWDLVDQYNQDQD